MHSPYRVFVTIVDTGSLAASARQLHLSPSAVSKQLSTLEQRLNAKLIQRSTRSIQVTEIGERFYQQCTTILQAIERAETEIKDLAGKPAGRLKVTLPQVLANQTLARMLSQFGETYPAITLELTVSNALENLIEKNLDAGFRVGPLEDSRLVAVELFQAHTIVCASADYLACHGAPQRLEDLANHRLLIPSHLNLSPYGHLLSLSSHHHFCDNANLLVEMAMAGLGIALGLDISLTPALKRGDLIQLPFSVARQSLPVSLVYLSRQFMPRRLALFIEQVKAYGWVEPLA